MLMLLQFFQANTLTSPEGRKDIDTAGSNPQLTCSPLTDDGLNALLESSISSYAFNVPVREPLQILLVGNLNIKYLVSHI